MHMQRKWNSGVLFSLLFTLLLTACSSGGGDSAAPVVPVVPAGTAEGLWTGMMAGRTVNGAVLDDGTYWFLYSAVDNSALMEGALQGNGSSPNVPFPSSNGLFFNNDALPPAPPEKHDVTVTASYAMQKDLSGTLTFLNAGGGTLAFTSTFSSQNSVPPVFPNVPETYSGSVFGFPHTMTISNLGVITVTTPSNTGYTTGVSVDVSGIELGCDFTGTLTPRSQGGNMYNIELTPDPSNIVTFPHCNPATLTGVAFFDADDPNPTVTTKRIYVLALNSDRNRVFPFTGTRP
ncbi:MAG: hypothetical protein JW395_1378 [Nitrospira sp.]|nr:hypothetical protein [Nitrospira sp.]